MPVVAISLPPDRLPVDILHVSDTHFHGRFNKKLRDHWNLLLESVREQIRRRDYEPAVIAFTGDLIDNPGHFGSRRAWLNGISALLDLATACGFIPQQPHADTWNGQIPRVWHEVLNRRVLIIPGNHDVFFKGLRVGWQRYQKRWRQLAAVKNGSRSLIGVSSLDLGPLAVRLIDSNGGRAFFKRARGVYAGTGGTASPWGFETKARFPVTLMHGHPLQLPYLIEGIDSEAAMMVDNSGSLLKDLASLGIRLVLHGHRHLPNVCGVTVGLTGGELRPITVVAAGSPTSPARQWPFFSYNWIRIEPDRRVSVQVMKRDKGQETFHRVDGSPRAADHGDFEYDAVEKTTRITEVGDECGTLTIHGFRVRPDRPDVHSIPFRIEFPEAASLAASRCVATRARGPSPALTWDRDAGVVRFDPPHTWMDDPLDLELSYCIHNCAPRSKWEASELLGIELDDDWTFLRSMCSTRLLTMHVLLPSALSGVDRTTLQVKIHGDDPAAVPPAPAWDEHERRMTLRIDRPRPGRTFELKWPLPSGRPRAAQESQLHIFRAWQAYMVREFMGGSRPLDGLCTELANLFANESLGTVDAGVFLVSTKEVVERVALPDAPRGLLLIGEHATIPLKERLNVQYGRGVVGRALRVGGLIWYNRLLAEESEREFREGRRTEPPENFYATVAGDRRYEAIIAIPVIPKDLSDSADPGSPAATLLVACFAAREPRSRLLLLNDKGVENQVKKAVGASLEQLHSFVYGDALQVPRLPA